MWRLVLCLLLCGFSDGYRILLMFPVASKSHGNLGEGFVRHLLTAGHEVTYITPYPMKNPSENLRQVDLSSNLDKFKSNTTNLRGVLDKVAVDEDSEMVKLMTEYVVHTVSHRNFQTLIMDKQEHFDVVVIEWLFSDAYAGLAAVFNCPFVWFSSMEPHSIVLSLIDEPLNPAYNPDIRASYFNPLSFTQRVSSLIDFVMMTFIKNFMIYPRDKEAYEKYFGPALAARGKTLPPFDEVLYNAALMLGNSHVSLGEPIKVPQNYIPIGGYHIDNILKPLPNNIKNIIDEAKDGVIYFSMGSILKSSDWPKEITKGLLKMFGELKQTVIWKFEEQLDAVPKNVHLMKWAPQREILNHSNCAVFITHGGLLSTTEAIHFGVPVIGIPVFGDQFANVGRAANKGFALKVSLTYDVADDLKKAIIDIISDPKYKKRAEVLSFIYHDRPVSPGAELVHWVQHAASTGGAPHLRSAALALAWYQRAYLDLAALVVILLISVVYAVKKMFNCLCTRKKVSVSKKKKKT